MNDADPQSNLLGFEDPRSAATLGTTRCKLRERQHPGLTPWFIEVVLGCAADYKLPPRYLCLVRRRTRKDCENTWWCMATPR